MGKNKKNKVKESGKQHAEAGQQRSDKNQKRDGKPKKTKVDHLTHIPSKLREIMKSKDRMKTGSLKPKKVKDSIRPKKKKAVNSKIGDIPVPHFRRRKRESVKAYLRRMNTETQHVLFLTKNQVERKPELAEDQQERPADTGKSEKKKEYNKARVQKQQLKKLDKQEEWLEKEKFVDDIAFGEVSMAPPSLSARPRKAPISTQKAPKGLLLNSLLGQSAATTAKPSMARQRLMEEERQRVVEAYRHLKKQRQQQHEASVGKLKNLQ